MAYEENMPRMEGAHHVILEGREQLSVSGVEEVESFDENTIIMTTVKGTLVVRGEDLHIEKLSLDGGDLRVEGVVDSLSYEDDSRERGGFFARLLRRHDHFGGAAGRRPGPGGGAGAGGGAAV